jgi:hypothetical protein
MNAQSTYMKKVAVLEICTNGHNIEHIIIGKTALSEP